MSSPCAASLLFIVCTAFNFRPALAFVNVEDDLEQDDASECVVLLQTTASYRIKTSSPGKGGDADVSVEALDAQAFQFLAPRGARFDRAKVAQLAAPALPSTETDGRASNVSMQTGLEIGSDICRLLSRLPVLDLADSDGGVLAPSAITCEDGLHVPLSLLQTSARYRLKPDEDALPYYGEGKVKGQPSHGLPLALDAWEQASDEEWHDVEGGGLVLDDLGVEFFPLSGYRRLGEGGEGSEVGEGSTYLLQTSATYRLVRAEEGADSMAPILRPRGRSLSRSASRGLACEQRQLAWSQDRAVKMEISDESLDMVVDLLAEGAVLNARL